MSAVYREPDLVRTDWPAVAALFLAGLGAAVQFAKVPPTVELLSSDLGLSLFTASLAVSIVGLVGIVFGVAASGLVNALGQRRLLLFAVTSAAVLAGLGGLAQGAADLLAVRFLEGFTHLVIVVAAPALMIAAATGRDRPIALALWAGVFGIGFAATNFVAPALIDAAGWRGVYAAHAAYMALIALLLWLVTKPLPRTDGTGRAPALRRLVDEHRTIYRSGRPLLLALVFGCYTLQFITYLTFLTIYYADILSMSAREVGTWIGVLSLGSLAATLAAGALLRLGGKPFPLVIASFAVAAACAVGIFALESPPAVELGLSILMLAASGLIPGLVYASIPVVADRPEMVVLTTGAIAQTGNLGTFSGPPLFAAFAAWAGWPGGAAFLVACCACGIVATAALAAMSRAAGPRPA